MKKFDKNLLSSSSEYEVGSKCLVTIAGFNYEGTIIFVDHRDLKIDFGMFETTCREVLKYENFSIRSLKEGSSILNEYEFRLI